MCDNWIEKLNVGSLVLVNTGYSYNNRERRGTVKRITPTGRIVVTVGSEELTFTKGGHMRGRSDGWLREYSDERWVEISSRQRKVALCQRLDRHKWGNEPLDVLERVASMLGLVV